MQTTGQRVSFFIGSGLVAAVLALSLLAIGMQWGRQQAATSWRLQTAVVHPGDTLWSIAQRFGCGRDPREVVQQLVRLNHLQSKLVRPGQELVVLDPSSCA